MCEIEVKHPRYAVNIPIHTLTVTTHTLYRWQPDLNIISNADRHSY